MKSRAPIGLLVVSICLAAAGQAHAVSWSRTYGGTAFDQTQHIQQTADGGYIVAGETSSFGAGRSDAWVLRLDAAGDVQWERAYGGTGADEAAAIREVAGGYVILGRTDPSFNGNVDFWVFRLDTAGAVIWERTYGGTDVDYPFDIRPTSDGGFIVVGSTRSLGTYDVWLLKLDSLGGVLWEKAIGGSSQDEGLSVLQTSDGGYAVLASTWSFGAGSQDSWLLKLDSRGNLVWQFTFGGAGTDGNSFRVFQAESMKETPDGGFILSGNTDSSGAGGSDLWLLKVDSSGSGQWQRTYGGPQNDQGYGLDFTSSGGYFLTGHIGSAGLWILKLDASGAIIWEKNSSLATPQSDIGYIPQGTTDGGVIIAGRAYGFGAGAGDAWILKLDVNGDIDASCPMIPTVTVSPVTVPVGIPSNAVAIATNAENLVRTSTVTVTSASVIEQCSSTGCVGDPWEEDDACITSSTVIEHADVQDHDFCDDDEDWIEFNACAGRTYEISTSALGLSTDTVLELYAPDCSLLLAQDDNGGGGLASRINWSATVDGTHHIRVRQKNGAIGVGRDYKIKLLGQTCPCALWSRTYGGTAIDWSEEIWQTSDGGFISAGFTSSWGAGNHDGWILRLDPQGNVLWEKAYGGAGGEELYEIVQTSDGGFIATGYSDSFGAGNRDAWVLKLDASGTPTWQKTYGGALWDMGRSVRQTADGGYVVAGGTSLGAGSSDVWVVKLDVSGAVTWEKAYGGINGEEGFVIRQISDGGYIVAGSEGILAPSFWVLRLDSTGAVVWQKSFGTGTLSDKAYDVHQTSDGGFIAVGLTSSFGPGSTSHWILKLDGTGNPQWQQLFGGTSSDDAWAVTKTFDGGFAVTGVTDSFADGGCWLHRLDSIGNLLWQRLYDGSSSDACQAIQQTTDGGFVLSGMSRFLGVNDQDGWILRVDEDGFIDSSTCSVVSSTSIAAITTTASPVTTTATTTVTSATVNNSAATVTNSTADLATQCTGACALPPTEVSPVGAVEPLVWIDKETLEWEGRVASGSDYFNLYRGRTSDLPAGDYGSCEEPDIPLATTTHSVVPPVDVCWFFLVTGENSAGEGPLGYTSSSAPRANSAPCP